MRLPDSITPMLAGPAVKPPVALGFEKNYPKNIFILVIEFLNELQLRQLYEDCVGTREFYETKNVVSLSVVYTLLSQPWFKTRVDRAALLRAVSNRLLVNSKVKRKAFHLKMAQVLLGEVFESERRFKDAISTGMARLSKAVFKTHDGLIFPNVTLFLMHLLAAVLGSRAPAGPSGRLPEGQGREWRGGEEVSEESSVRSNLTSKQEYRRYMKELIHLYNNEGLSLQQLQEGHCQFAQLVQESARQLRADYGLVEGVPNWNQFVEGVAARCLESRKRGQKLTNNLMNLWIDEFKQSSFKVELSPTTAVVESAAQVEPQVKPVCLPQVTPYVYSQPILPMLQPQCNWYWLPSQSFEPIVLQSDSHSFSTS